MSRVGFGVWAAMVLMLVPWAGAQSYTVTPLGTLGGIFSNVNAINDHDQITGYASLSDGVEHAFLWTSAQGMRDLGTLGGSTSYGFGLNNLGQVVGGSFPASENFYHAFVWTENNGMHDLGTLGGNYSYAEAINDSGEVVGYAYLPGDDSYHAFYWTAAEGLQDDLMRGAKPFRGRAAQVQVPITASRRDSRRRGAGHLMQGYRRRRSRAAHGGKSCRIHHAASMAASRDRSS